MLRLLACGSFIVSCWALQTDLQQLDGGLAEQLLHASGPAEAVARRALAADLQRQWKEMQFVRLLLVMVEFFDRSITKFRTWHICVQGNRLMHAGAPAADKNAQHF